MAKSIVQQKPPELSARQEAEQARPPVSPGLQMIVDLSTPHIPPSAPDNTRANYRRNIELIRKRRY
jgi:hypothetical protein